MPRNVLFIIGSVAIIAVILLGIRLLGDGDSTAVESSQSESTGQWVGDVEEGSLIFEKISAWHSASDEDRLAICGQVIVEHLSDDRNVDWDRLKIMAVKLESRISERVADGNIDESYIRNIMLEELLLMGVLRKSGDYKFTIDLDK